VIGPGARFRWPVKRLSREESEGVKPARTISTETITFDPAIKTDDGLRCWRRWAASDVACADRPESRCPAASKVMRCSPSPSVGRHAEAKTRPSAVLGQRVGQQHHPGVVTGVDAGFDAAGLGCGVVEVRTP
jgi:hypothetical protein